MTVGRTDVGPDRRAAHAESRERLEGVSTVQLDTRVFSSPKKFRTTSGLRSGG